MAVAQRNVLVAVFISVSFFLIGLFTLSNYGISWDEPIHFHRGQAYLHYFLTGETEFKTVSGNQSYFQSNSLPASYFLLKDSGHPPLNGILASLTNYIFYQQLGIMGDIESHHLFNILTASILVFIVVLFASESYGIFAGIIAGLSLSLYPLFFGESRFNIKDPAEAAFFGLTIYASWKAINTWNWKWVILGALGFGLGLGTKFNILFLPAIIIPWAAYKILFLDNKKTKFSKSFIISVLIAPLIIAIIFFGTWPFLWSNPWNNLMEIFGYYKQIGSGFNHQTSAYYLPFGINSYPLIWILYTTPPFILFLSAIGSIVALINFKKKDGAAILWLLWLAVPTLRVILPGTSVYGGVRQIMEFIPALALISGLGALQIKNLVIKKLPVLKPSLVIALILVGFFQIGLVLIKIHPNENVYFNSLIGGLSGAKKADIPSYGNSFGNAYYQAIKWFNNNAAPGASVGLIQGTGLNIPKIMLRGDLFFNNQSWSGMNRTGEYMLELTHQNPGHAYPYAWDYIERVLEPVYEVKVDNVAIAKLWHNDLAHSKKQFQIPEKNLNFTVKTDVQAKSLILKLDRQSILTRITLSYQTENCTKPKGSVALSTNGFDYKNEPDPYPYEFVTEPEKKPNTIYQYFAVPQTQYIRFTDESTDSCLFKTPDIKIKGF